MGVFEVIITVLGVTFAPILLYLGKRQKDATNAAIIQSDSHDKGVIAQTSQTSAINEMVRVMTAQNTTLIVMCERLDVLWEDRQGLGNEFKELCTAVTRILEEIEIQKRIDASRG